MAAFAGMAHAIDRPTHCEEPALMSIFQSHAWQSSWWDIWGEQYHLNILKRWDGSNNGLYVSSSKLKGILPVKTLEFVGCNYREFTSTRTEYNTALKQADATSETALQNLLNDADWSDAIFSDMPLDSPSYRFLCDYAKENDYLLRVLKEDTSWGIRTEGEFQKYLEGLGKGTRLRLFNRRKLLETFGEVSVKNIYGSKIENERFFALLNSFHQRRWGKPIYSPRALEFNKLFLRRIVQEGGRPVFSILSFGNRALSVLYNVEYMGCVYNFQIGFDEKFHPKLSLGKLHLGYEIEKSFFDPSIEYFDLLAGSGKNESYKEQFSTVSVPFVSLMLVRAKHMKILYRIVDGARGRLK